MFNLLCTLVSQVVSLFLPLIAAVQVCQFNG